MLSVVHISWHSCLLPLLQQCSCTGQSCRIPLHPPPLIRMPPQRTFPIVGQRWCSCLAITHEAPPHTMHTYMCSGLTGLGPGSNKRQHQHACEVHTVCMQHIPMGVQYIRHTWPMSHSMYACTFLLSCTTHRCVSAALLYMCNMTTMDVQQTSSSKRLRMRPTTHTLHCRVGHACDVLAWAQTGVAARCWGLTISILFW